MQTSNVVWLYYQTSSAVDFEVPCFKMTERMHCISYQRFDQYLALSLLQDLSPILITGRICGHTHYYILCVLGCTSGAENMNLKNKHFDDLDSQVNKNLY